ncbi:cell morphogenesis N-terminal-domain-containing protein [Amylocystis lapponica]|nr:cell morphogenesis N-terminal-domain-containing protein [Amylocystis lapponica]
MSSEAIQITIPDFDDDDYSTPVFGRSQPGGLWGTLGSGQDSPTILTPVALSERTEKGYFHSRGDSVTSEDSAHSTTQYTTRKLKSPFAHSAQSSIATPSTSPFTKKSSFASLRNAFKSNKASEPAPPVPSLDHHAYPALKNPFNRSTSSLAQLPPVPMPPRSTHASPPQFRPSTPASGESRMRGTPMKSKNHSYARSQHSHSESAFHSSDGGSDHGHGFPYLSSSSPPPVPPMPGASRLETRSLSDLEDKITMDPRTPSDYALHAIFIRFAASAESHLETFLQQPLEREPLLVDLIGPGVDPTLDELLLSLGKIAQKHAKPVIDSVMRWRKSQNDSVSAELLRQHLAQPGTGRGMRAQEATVLLNERKSLASIYVMCRALIAATEAISKDGLGEALGHSLEELTFEQFRRPDVKMLTQSANHRSNADLYARLLGHLANVRFESVTDRFLTELGPVAAGQVPKDADFKYENLLRGLQHVQIKVGTKQDVFYPTP